MTGLFELRSREHFQNYNQLSQVVLVYKVVRNPKIYGVCTSEFCSVLACKHMLLFLFLAGSCSMIHAEGKHERKIKIAQTDMNLIFAVLKT